MQNTKLNAPNSSKKSQLDVLNMVVELIKTEGKIMGEVQLEKGTRITARCHQKREERREQREERREKREESREKREERREKREERREKNE